MTKEVLKYLIQNLKSKFATKDEIPSSLPANGGNADTIDNIHIWTGTQAQYDAIGTKDNNTLYFIIGE